MKLKETFEQRGVWETIYVGVFFGPIYATLSSAIDNSVEMIPLIIIGLIVSAALGLGVYRLIKSKPHTTKSLVAITIIIVVSLISIQIETYSNDLKYNSCEICGFISVDKETHECKMCVSKPWDESSMKEGYRNKEEYVKEEQLYWFSTQTSDEKVNFYLPFGEKKDDNFSKDKTWTPMVTETEVRDYSKGKWRE